MDMSKLEDMMDPEMQAQAVKLQNKTKAVDASFGIATSLVSSSLKDKGFPGEQEVKGLVAIATSLQPHLLRAYDKAIDDSMKEAKLANTQTSGIS